MSAQENKKLVEDAFTAWLEGDVCAFFDIVDDHVHWTVLGTCPVSGRYKCKQAFVEGAVKPVFERLAAPMQPELRGLIAYDDWVVLQWSGQAPIKDNGIYQNEFCWVMRIQKGKIVECTAYLDTVAASDLFR